MPLQWHGKNPSKIVYSEKNILQKNHKDRVDSIVVKVIACNRFWFDFWYFVWFPMMPEQRIKSKPWVLPSVTQNHRKQVKTNNNNRKKCFY